MKGNYKNIYFYGVFALLILSCSLVNNIPSNQVTKSASEYSEARELTLPLDKPKPEHCTVETKHEQGKVNLRVGPGTAFDVLVVLQEGDRLEALAFGDWLKVSATNGVSGYINSNYCTIGE
ncbi:MAG: SH3 domain-containing protein [Anaerolineae bacterium]|jgi:SH3-like domain-containing protein|nr:SH3 domain-containing protein [Anaerolineae bacterium]MBT7189053.1 SH3 domain-containing protein [Anaerolineae bacterium]MBT7990326.1 SH3 domain-containing protein [Anaerolineae bacterium]